MIEPGGERLSRLRKALPNPLPRPSDELPRLERAWITLSGWRAASAVDSRNVGRWHLATALVFLVLAGVLALLLRVQLALPQNRLVTPSLYNQLFTMHGTVMMFLFAVPAVQALAVCLLPAMLGARDLPFPRLSAYAFWTYAMGGATFFGTLFFGLAPSGGWFMYPPLAAQVYSPGTGTGFWLFAVGLIAISALAGAINVIVAVLRTRAPGMSLGRMPIYAWTMLVVAVMIVLAFPPLIAGACMLALERALHWPFFVAAQGGDPLLWQHLFWLFGHAGMYIVFLPAAGLLSMLVPALAQTPLVGYRWVVAALIGVGILALGSWAHHMFATGLPKLSLDLFSAASMAVAIPIAMLVFAWIATLWRGNVQKAPPTWFLAAFFGSFVLGGLTGIMLAVIPFDRQVHDTHFVVAHLHYVLIGGVVFPLFAALYFWAPLLRGRKLSARIGTWACALMFVGFTGAFLPMHWTGLRGMPRRVHTYLPELGWGTLNLASTLGAFVLAAGVGLVLIDLLRRAGAGSGANADPWRAGTLEWLPRDDYGIRSIPRVETRYPLWDSPELAREVDSGQHFLPGSATGARETIVTSALDAHPQHLLLLPASSWLPLLAAAGTVACVLLLTVDRVLAATLAAVLAAAALWRWLGQTDRGPVHAPAEVGEGLRLPVYVTGSLSHSRWATVALLLPAASLFASLAFAYQVYRTITPGAWPPMPEALPHLGWPVASALLWIGSAWLLGRARRALERHGRRSFRAWIVLALVPAVVAFGAALYAQQRIGIDPTEHVYGAIVYGLLAWQGLWVALVTLMAVYLLTRSWARRLDGIRSASFDNCRLLWLYSVGQGVAMLALVHGAPLVAGSAG